MPNQEVKIRSSLKNGLKEYCKFPSLLMRELKGYQKLSSGAKDIWEILYDLAKFDAHGEVAVSIEKLREIRNCKSRRTVELNLKNLEKERFIKKVKSYSKIGSQLINTYRVLIPIEIAERLNDSKKRVSIKPNSPILQPSINELHTPSSHGKMGYFTTPPENNCGPFNDYFEEDNINNCYSPNTEFLEKTEKEIVELCIVKREEAEAEVLKYYPAKDKPSTLGKAVLRHMLTAPIQFETHINEQLTSAQETVVKAIVSFWKSARYVSSPQECYEWIKSLLLNRKALSQCGNRFLQRINVINKLMREKRFSKPFVERYRSHAAYQAERKQFKPQKVLTKVQRPSPQDQAKQSLMDQCEAGIEKVRAKLALLAPDGVSAERQSLLSLVESMKYQMQGAQYV